MLSEYKEAIDAIAKLDPAQRGTYQTWLVVEVIRDVSYYILLAVIAYTLGRRLIHAVLAAVRESRRERAEWLVIVELVVLMLLGIMQLAAMFIASQDPNDPLAVFCTAFWREFLHPPESIPINPARYLQPEGGEGGVGGHPQPTEDDEFYGRIPKAAGGAANKADLPILVEPHAAADEVIGRDGDGIKVRVTGEAGESRSNKALIELVAIAVGVKPYQVTLTKGHYQTRKAVQIQGLSVAQLQARLAEMPDAD